MKLSPRIYSAIGLAGLAFMLASVGGTAQAADKCVRILANESEGQKESMDPVFQAALGNPTHLRAVYEPLAMRDNQWRLKPVLAESWESNHDGTEWTFHLRHGVKFHDGKDFGAQDVVYTFRRLLDPKIAPGAAASLSFLKPDGIQAIDTYTVRFTTDKPVVELPLLINGKFSLIVQDGAKAEDLRLHENGTGPFMQQQFVPGGAVRILKKNPNYWQAGLPKADCLELRVISESTSRLGAITSGEADLVLLADPTTVLALKGNSDVQILNTSAATAVYMAMATDIPPFNNPDVREAMKLVVDRKAMVDTVLLGYGVIGNDNPVPSSSPDAYRKDPIPQNISKAKELMAKAGHADGIQVDLYTSNDSPFMPLIALAYAQMASEAGIKVNVINAPPDSYWDDIWMKKPFFVSYLAGRPTGEALALNLLSTSNWNETQWKSKEFDDLLAKAGATLNPDERRKVYQQAQQLVAENAGIIGPIFNEIVSVMRKECTGYQPNIDASSYDYSDLHCD